MLLMSVKIGFDVSFVIKGKNPIFTSTVILTYHIVTNSLITQFLYDLVRYDRKLSSPDDLTDAGLINFI